MQWGYLSFKCFKFDDFLVNVVIVIIEFRGRQRDSCKLIDLQEKYKSIRVNFFKMFVINMDEVGVIL